MNFNFENARIAQEMLFRGLVVAVRTRGRKKNDVRNIRDTPSQNESVFMFARDSPSSRVSRERASGEGDKVLLEALFQLKQRF